MSALKIRPAVQLNSYLILVPEILVAQDISLTIADYDMDAHVIIAASSAEAEQAIAPLDSITFAFVAARPSTFLGSPLATAIVERGARLVLLGMEAEGTGPTPEFDVLAQPFDTEAVLARLAGK